MKLWWVKKLAKGDLVLCDGETLSPEGWLGWWVLVDGEKRWMHKSDVYESADDAIVAYQKGVDSRLKSNKEEHYKLMIEDAGLNGLRHDVMEEASNANHKP